ncbi:hypothetical protein [Streptomyces sp. NPDC058629]|uniref:hypothetical protein n=1 Tax=Streptomyces sp. NPDC058629 TaxID=3346565 RepID=UPI0036473BAB
MLSLPRSILSLSACAMLLTAVTPAYAGSRDARPAAPSALTAVTCTIAGTGRFTNTTNGSQGVTNLVPRDVDVTGTAEGSCLDLRIDRSATGGHAIVKRSVSITGHLTDATCLVASGHYTATTAWTLDDNTTVTSSNTIDVVAGNFFEQVPGAGTVTSGLFAGAVVENNTIYPDLLQNAAACATTAGLRSYDFATEVNVLQV